ncbi:MAG: serine hydrolase, partial [Patescibacteria group bacterium]|nr:serine hydrolase [Patescibacteria group bacterium]
NGSPNFLVSFGFTLVGMFFLFFGSIFASSHYRAAAKSVIFSPASEIRFGGDVAPANTNARLILPSTPLLKKQTEFEGKLSARAVVAVDDKTGAILFSKNLNEARPLASLTKLMSAMVLLDLPIHWASTTVVKESDLDGSDHYFQVGEEFTFEDLWNAALVGSSNTAITIILRGNNINMEEFANLMNKKANDLRLFSAHFVEPTGLDANNKANAIDSVKLLKNALLFDKIYKSLQTAEYYAKPLGDKKLKRIWNTDRLLTDWIPNNFSRENIAGKTGYIIDSDYNFVVYLADGKGHSARIAILGAESAEARFTEARDLAEWIFANYLWPDEKGYEALVK